MNPAASTAVKPAAVPASSPVATPAPASQAAFRPATEVKPAITLTAAAQPNADSQPADASPLSSGTPPALQSPPTNESQPKAETIPAPKANPSTEANRSQAFEVTLNQAVFASLNDHPVIGAELQRIQQARADYLTTSLFPNPQLFTDGQLIPLTHPFTPDRQGGPPQQDVILTYPIDWFLFGKRTAAMTSAHFGVHVAQADFENLVRLRVVETATAFFDAVEAKGLVEVARQNVQNLSKLEAITKQAVIDGGRPAIEENRVRLDLIGAEQRLRTALATEQTTLARLRALMGDREIPAIIVPVSDLERRMPPPVMDIDRALSVAQQSRPDLLAIQFRATQAGANVNVQQRAARPVIAPSLGYTHQYQAGAIGYPDADSWSAAVTMSVPIYDRNQGNIIKAQAEQQRIRFEYAAATLNLEAELRQAIAELTAANDNANSVATEQLQLAESVRDSIVTAFENGGRPLIDVLDAQRNYRETYSLYISTRAAYSRALYRYYAAMGQRINDDGSGIRGADGERVAP